MRVPVLLAVTGVCVAIGAAQTPAPATKTSAASKTVPAARSAAGSKSGTAAKTVSTTPAVKRPAAVRTTTRPTGSTSATAGHPAAKTGPAQGKTTASARRPVSRKPTVTRTTFRPHQTQPAPERYQEIQSALVAKGYLRQEQANGNWDQDSIDALKRFQADQKLDPTGKLTSMSLIALGLGPKHEAVTTSPSGPGN